MKQAGLKIEAKRLGGKRLGGNVLGAKILVTPKIITEQMAFCMQELYIHVWPWVSARRFFYAPKEL